MNVKMSRKGAMGQIKLPEGNFQLLEAVNEPIPMSLVMPGQNGFLAENVLEDMWTLSRVPASTTASEGAELDFDKDVGGAGAARPQPGGLRMNLSAVDVETVIKRKRGKSSLPASSPGKKSRK